MLVRGELRKACGLPALILLLVVIAVLWQDASRWTSFAATQTPMAVASHNDMVREEARACRVGRPHRAGRCALARETLAMNRNFIPNAVGLGRRAMALETAPGIVIYVSHELATGFGWLVLAAFVALHVTGERASGAVGASVMRTGRRRYLVGKVASTFFMCAGGLAVASLLLYVARPTFTSEVRVPVGRGGVDSLPGPMRTLPAHGAWTSWATAGRSVASALVVLFVVSCLFVLVAALFREPVAAAVVLGGTVVAMFGVSVWLDRSTWVPMRALSSFLGLMGRPFGVNDVRLWDHSSQPATIYEHVAPSPVPIASSVIWVVAVGVVCALALRTFLRRPVL